MSEPTASATPRTGSFRLLAPGAGLLILTYIGFISLGLPDAAFGVAWPSLRDEFELTERAFGAGLLAVFAGFILSSLYAGTFLRLVGAGRLLAWSTTVAALGLVGFALAPYFALFLLAGLLVGLGGGAIDSGLNAYAAGHYSARQMNWLHAAFGLGAALGPFLMTLALTEADWRAGYGAIAALMLILAGLFFLTRNAWARTGRAVAGAPPAAGIREVVRIPRVWLQIATFFVYAGLEITAGQWAFAVLSQSRGYSVEAAGAWASAFWLSLFLGRVLLGFGAAAIGADRLIRGGALGALAGVAVYALDPAGFGPAGLVLAGFAFAPIFPMLVHRTPATLGAGVAPQAIGFQIGAAMMGATAVPSLAGFIAEAYGLEATMFLLVAAAVLHLVLIESVLRLRPAGPPPADHG